MLPENRPDLSLGAVRRLVAASGAWHPLQWVRTRRRLVIAFAAIALAGYLALGVVVVGPAEIGLVRRLGKSRPPVLGPGLHLRWPPPLESVTKVQPALVRSVPVGGSDPSALFLTGDANQVALTGSVEYRLTEAAAADLQFGVETVDALVAATAEGVFREAATRLASEEIVGPGRSRFEASAESAVRARLGANGWTLAVDRVRVLEAHPPRALIAAHRDVEAAAADAAGVRSVAEAFAVERRLTARAEAQARRDVATSAAYRIRTHADAQRQAFLLRSQAHAVQPALTEFRMWWETLASSYAGRPKLIFDPRAGGRRHIWVADPETMVLIRGATKPALGSASAEPKE